MSYDLKVESVTEDDEFYFIQLSNDACMVQRKQASSASVRPLTLNEEILIAMCQKVLELQRKE